jgi:hypothetical protein
MPSEAGKVFTALKGPPLTLTYMVAFAIIPF